MACSTRFRSRRRPASRRTAPRTSAKRTVTSSGRAPTSPHGAIQVLAEQERLEALQLPSEKPAHRSTSRRCRGRRCRQSSSRQGRPSRATTRRPGRTTHDQTTRTADPRSPASNRLGPPTSGPMTPSARTRQWATPLRSARMSPLIEMTFRTRLKTTGKVLMTTMMILAMVNSF